MPPATQPPAQPAPVVAPETPAPPVEAPAAPAEPAPGSAAEPAPAPEVARRAPFMALLLPLESPDFRNAADAFLRGVEAAALQQPATLPIEIHATDASPERILETYTSVLQQGAAVVIGPMTRNGVSAIATSGLVMVPTLTLNQPEGDQPLPPGLYAFGLSVEDEARVLARRAYQAGVRRIGLIGTPAPLSRRTRAAFLDTWQQLGGQAVAMLDADPQGDLAALRAGLSELTLDAVFLAAPYREARLIRPYLPAQTPVYATSQIHMLPSDTLGMVDLNGVRFIDMPWLLSDEHPSVAVYPRPADLSGGVLRFYALGVDAYRIAAQLAQGRRHFELEGLTGDLSTRPDGTVERRPRLAVFQDGAARLLE